MGNRVAVYDNPHIQEAIYAWFEFRYGGIDGRIEKTLEDLYQDYCEWSIAPQHAYDRMDIHAFAKCLVACKIIDIGGWWEFRPNYTPNRREITRATA